MDYLLFYGCPGSFLTNRRPFRSTIKPIIKPITENQMLENIKMEIKPEVIIGAIKKMPKKKRDSFLDEARYLLAGNKSL